MDATTVIAFGEVLWDLLPTKATLGGAPLNFAYRLSALGRRVVPVSRLGCDRLGAQAFHAMERLGLETGWVQWDDDRPTGTVEVTLDQAGQPSYRIVPEVAYDHIAWTPELEGLAREASCICFGTLIQRQAASRQTLAKLLAAAPEALKMLDINLRQDCHSLETVQFSLGQADVLKLNDQELEALRVMFEMPAGPLPELAAGLLRLWDLRYVLVTLGERGVFAVGPDGEHCYIPGQKVELVDALGSGDAFAAGFIHGLLGGATLRDACTLGNALGALAATRTGGTEPIEQAELQAFLDREDELNVDSELAQFMD